MEDIAAAMELQLVVMVLPQVAMEHLEEVVDPAHQLLMEERKDKKERRERRREKRGEYFKLFFSIML